MDTPTPPIDKKLRPRSALVHAAINRSGFDETCEALFMTSGYVYGSAEEAEAAFKTDGIRYVYSRYRNPTVDTFERRLAEYEGADRCYATSSGMAAVFAALLCFLRSGDRVVAPFALFSSCTYILAELLPRWGVQAVFVDGTDLDQWREALAQPTAAVFLETPSNPMLDVVDLRAVAEMAHAAGARVIADNAFASPVVQKPIALGADVVIYSATKHIDGQGRSLGGVILCDHAFGELIGPFLRHTGPALSPFNAWLLLKGLETLELRVAAQSEAAEKVARFLERHAAVSLVRYPTLESHPQRALAARQMSTGGTMVAFDYAGGKDAAFAALNRLRLFRISNNLGDSKSLATHPATSTHQRLSDADKARVGIGPGSIRLSIGLEVPEDLIEDLEQALA